MKNTLCRWSCSDENVTMRFCAHHLLYLFIFLAPFLCSFAPPSDILAIDRFLDFCHRSAMYFLWSSKATPAYWMVRSPLVGIGYSTTSLFFFAKMFAYIVLFVYLCVR